MSLNNKDKFMLLSVATLGAYPLYLYWSKRHAVAKAQNHGGKIIVNLDQFLQTLGGISNIESMEYMRTRIKVMFDDNAKVNLTSLEKLTGIYEVHATSRYITVTVGKSAKAIVQALSDIM